MYILINENRSRKSFLSDYAAKNNKEAVEVDCDSPGKNYRLKINHKEYSGVDQWEVDVELEKAQLLELFRLAPQQYIFSKYDSGEQLSMLKYSVSGNDTQKAACAEVNAWIDLVLDEYYMRREAINTAQNLQDLKAVSFDFSNMDEHKPDIELSNIKAMA